MDIRFLFMGFGFAAKIKLLEKAEN